MRLNINKKYISTTLIVLFNISLLLLIINLAAGFLRYLEVVKLKYLFIGSGIFVMITLILLLFYKKWWHAIIIFILVIVSLFLLGNKIMDSSISHIRHIKGSNYLLEAQMRHYRIWEQKRFYDLTIAEKKSDIFYTPTMKTGIVPTLSAELVDENKDFLILKIKAGPQVIIDTIYKSEKINFLDK